MNAIIAFSLRNMQEIFFMLTANHLQGHKSLIIARENLCLELGIGILGRDNTHYHGKS